ncbi:hypothetical protein B0F90DRAFT_1621823 [Multifurca ochricompacta]|uniref:Guanine nucleotide-binding protein-like 1 n=1 Tax=Multifurca ochricompacta TaxID=376703 RepID=A0AAD4MGZ4_9AGAM|nr:hypothetical protein B0F90DRAFT_1621823 [Multifurca ochricompacta]
MHRKKPVSGKQHKAQIQAKRARKRGDIDSVHDKSNPPPAGSGLSNSRAVISTQRQLGLESSFIRIPSALLEQGKAIAASVPLPRPIRRAAAIWALHSGRIPSEQESQMRAQIVCMCRPRWRYEMSKKEVEKNEAGLFTKWLEKSDALVEEWVSAAVAEKQQSLERLDHNTMPLSPSIFERNLEVWRQLWRVTEVSQILLVLLDSRCPLLHLSPSLVKFLSLPRHRIILVLTKVDISGPHRAEAWATYLRLKYSFAKVVMGGTTRQLRYDPHIPRTFKEQLVLALKEVHQDMLRPPEKIRDDPEKVKNWRPSVRVEVDWDGVLHSGPASRAKLAGKESDITAASHKETEADPLTIGLIGQPNVGKSSLLNALFNTTRVRASRTPGKTKHFQTLFWSSDIRLVDCPGLVLPDLVPMEMQVLGGILPIARMPAIPLCISFVAQLLPLESILGLRTWREGPPRTGDLPRQEIIWTAMDIMTAYAEKRGWVTAKAGRPDVNRAGNAILRLLAEGKIKWAFWPPEYDESQLPDADANPGYGIWIPSKDDLYDDEDGDDSEGQTGDDTEGEKSESISSSDADDEKPVRRMFALLGEVVT